MAEREKRYDNDIIAALAKHIITRLWIIIILLIAYCGVMTYLYIDERNSYETYEIEQEVDTGDGDAFVAGVGDVYYGTNPTESDDPQTEDGR